MRKWSKKQFDNDRHQQNNNSEITHILAEEVEHWDYKKAVYENGWYRAEFRELGYFQLVEDLTPPTIATNGFVNGINASKLSRIMFTVKDDTEDLESFEAKLDGQWLRFTNDKGRNFIYKFDEKCPPGQHKLEITATDMAGNETTKTFEFTR